MVIFTGCGVIFASPGPRSPAVLGEIMAFFLRIFFWGSLLATAACAGVHAATFFGVATYQVLWLVPPLFVIWPFAVWHWRRLPRLNLLSPIFGVIPRWMKIAAGALLAYIFIIYFVCRALNDGGLPVTLDDGRLVLQSGTQIIRALTPAEFQQAQAVQVRLLTGQLLAFYGLAVLLLRAIWIKSGPAMADAHIPASER